ncbi:hypothetical protein [Halolamina sp.]|uniref:hypothetical protein n=1 Tax=Halolamina sp. TaxID=1940283 RepID=UPI0031F2F284
MGRNPTRRGYLAGVGGVITAGLAGCSESSESPNSNRTGSTELSTGGSDTANYADLDLREANVVGVTVEQADGEYRFDVSLIHDDDGEDGYADWWQVETREGAELGRRDLLHAHGTQVFTRSSTISVPATVSEVVVRGHDETHGYGGQAMILTVETGETDAVKQGPEPQSFAE